uniref:Protein CASC3 n=1 Tax=Ascaris lumbricoides TaxID=6252 RepID=A0A9J2P0D6_ASCLU
MSQEDGGIERQPDATIEKSGKCDEGVNSSTAERGMSEERADSNDSAQNGVNSVAEGAGVVENDSHSPPHLHRESKIGDGKSETSELTVDSEVPLKASDGAETAGDQGNANGALHDEEGSVGCTQQAANEDREDAAENVEKREVGDLQTAGNVVNDIEGNTRGQEPTENSGQSTEASMPTSTGEVDKDAKNDVDAGRSSSSEAFDNMNGHRHGQATPQEYTQEGDETHEIQNALTDEEAIVELDDDENVDNPAYIPKSGRYYMHDSRNANEERIQEPTRSRADGKWKHDRYDERSQRPKSRRELVNKYGFDIRDQKTEEGAHTGRTYASDTSRRDTRGKSDNRRTRDDQRGDGIGFTRNTYNNASRPSAQHNNRGGASGPATVYTQHTARIIRPSLQESSNIGGTGNAGRNEGDKMYSRNEGGGNRMRGGKNNRGVQQRPTRAQTGGSGGGGKRYSTQRLATNYAEQGSHTVNPLPTEWLPNFQQQQQQGAMHVAQPRSIQHEPPLASHAAPSPHHPPPAAIHAAPNFHMQPSDIVYFDPQQQLIRKQVPPPPRAKKRLEIVPPTQSNVAADTNRK